MLSAVGGLGLVLTGLLFAGFYTEEIGVRVLGSAGAILLGGYLYLYEAAVRLISEFQAERYFDERGTRIDSDIAFTAVHNEKAGHTDRFLRRYAV